MWNTKIYVVPHDNWWAVRKEKTQRVSYTCNTQAEAIEKWKEIAKENNTTIVIQDKTETLEKFGIILY